MAASLWAEVSDFSEILAKTAFPRASNPQESPKTTQSVATLFVSPPPPFCIRGRSAFGKQTPRIFTLAAALGGMRTASCLSFPLLRLNENKQRRRMCRKQDEAASIAPFRASSKDSKEKFTAI